MARKNPFHVIRIRREIYDKLAERRELENRTLESMTLYIEKILMDYAEAHVFEMVRHLLNRKDAMTVEEILSKPTYTNEEKEPYHHKPKK